MNRDAKEACRLFTRAVDGGDLPSLRMVGELYRVYRVGWGSFARDPPRAAKLLVRAAEEAGDSEALVLIGDMFAGGELSEGIEDHKVTDGSVSALLACCASVASHRPAELLLVPRAHLLCAAFGRAHFSSTKWPPSAVTHRAFSSTHTR